MGNVKEKDIYGICWNGYPWDKVVISTIMNSECKRGPEQDHSFSYIVYHDSSICMEGQIEELFLSLITQLFLI